MDQVSISTLYVLIQNMVVIGKKNLKYFGSWKQLVYYKKTLCRKFRKTIVHNETRYVEKLPFKLYQDIM